jgi:hypothetical protein
MEGSMEDGTKENGASDEGSFDTAVLVGELVTFNDDGAETGIPEKGELVVGSGDATSVDTCDGINDAGTPNVEGNALLFKGYVGLVGSTRIDGTEVVGLATIGAFVNVMSK